MYKITVCCSAIAIVTVVVWAGTVSALQTTLAVDQAVVIVNPSVEADRRALVEYEIPDYLSSAEILYAELRGQIDATLGDRQVAVEVQALPLNTDWEANSVTWQYPWSAPGGDTAAGFERSYLVGAGRQQIRIDVTDLVRQWARGERGNSGVMLLTTSSFGGNMSFVADGGPEGFRVPSIRIWYLPRSER